MKEKEKRGEGREKGKTKRECDRASEREGGRWRAGG